ncbi:MAG TPA: HYR domain-containing protein, partial [Bacteroidia bacterium]|nr:HYR domain-containing protein [Bacteroidia bacterium]
SAFAVGTGTVVFQATDASGNTATCSFTVTVTDNEAPSVTCPANIVLANDAGLCSAIATFSASGTDNCPGVSVVQTSGGASGSAFPVGSSTVVFRATDASNNATTCSFTITVNDLEAPNLDCGVASGLISRSNNAFSTNSFANDVTLPNDGGLCGALYEYDNEATDNCPGVTVAQTAGLSSGSTFPVGNTLNTFVATDASGNSTSCSFVVTVVDAEAPTVACPANISVANDPGLCSAVVTFSASAADNCPGVSLAQTSGGASGSAFAVGTGTVVFQATDASGNTATCSFTVTVSDLEAPSLDCGIAGGLISGPNNSFANDVTLPSDFGSCGALYEYENEATDNCPGVTVAQTAGLPSGSIFPAGSTTNTFVATDAAGNTTSCSFVVTVVDAEAPVVTCPANISVSNDPGLCSAVVTYTASATDNCPGVTVSLNPASGSTFALGTTTVTATATDASGNNATCTFTVTVNDTEAPVALCQDVTVQLDNSGNASVTASQVDNGSSDNCGIASISLTPTTFNCSNVSGGPAIADLFFSEYIEGSSNNKCLEIYNGTGTAVNLSGYAIAMYFNGANTPNLTINLSGTVADGDVYVVCQSTAATNFTAQADLLNSSGWYNGDDAVALTKNGNAIDIIGSIGEDPGTEWGTGLNSTADNTLVRNGNVSGGNTSNTTGFPAVASEWTGLANNTASSLGSHGVSGATASATLTVTDVNGNVSTCSANVTVEDNTPPTAVCQNITVSISGNGSASVTASQVDNGSSDNCGIASITVNPNSFGCANVGQNNTVTLTVTDLSGNVGTCTASVTVLETTPPTALCQNLTVQLDANGQASITAAQVNNGSSDNCAIQSLAVSPSSFNCSNVTSNGSSITELFISEYLEGSGNNKCIELYNGTGAAVSMSGYQLQ